MCGIVGISSRQGVGTIAQAEAMDNLEKPCYDFKGIANAVGGRSFPAALLIAPIQNRNS